MKLHTKIGLAAFLVAVLGAVVWQSLRLSAPREPSYKGKPLSVWLQGYQPGLESPELDEALRKIGTNAVPTLLGMLRAKDGLKLKLTQLAQRVGIGIYYPLASTRNLQGEKGFVVLAGDAHLSQSWTLNTYYAHDAVPELIRIYEQNISASSQNGAANALAAIGPAAKEALPSLIRRTTDMNPDVRARAVYALGRIGHGELVVPLLIKRLHDSDTEVRCNAAIMLSGFGKDATRAIPTLVEMLADNQIRACVAIALGGLHAEPDLVVPALVKSLGDPDPLVRTDAAGALKRFGPGAKPAVASLVQLLGDTTQEVRDEASRALKAIDPEALPEPRLK